MFCVKCCILVFGCVVGEFFGYYRFVVVGFFVFLLVVVVD